MSVTGGWCEERLHTFSFARKNFMAFPRVLGFKNEPLVNPEPNEDGELRASLTLVHSPGTDLRGHVRSALSPGNPRKAGWNPAAPRAAPDLQKLVGEEPA